MQSNDVPYDVSIQKTHATVTLRPQLTEAEWDEVSRAGDDILSQINGHKPRALMLDLTPLEYMGSSLVAMIVRCWKAVQPQKQQFVVVSNSDVVREVLDLSGLAKMWSIVSTPEEGLKSLGISSATAGGESPAVHWGIILGAVALVVAAIGTGLWFAQPAQRSLATGLIAGGAVVGLLSGLGVMVLAQFQTRRVVGLGLVLISACAGVFRLMQ